MKLVAIALTLILAGPAAPVPDPWEGAIRRLPPSAFPQLPVPVARYLSRRGCTIPQAWDNDEPHNVVRGEFVRRGASDWAVLCSQSGRSAILVFHEVRPAPTAELAPGNDINWVQTVDGDGGVGYSRIISAVDRRYILDFREAFGGPLPEPLDHQGIEDYFEGKASIIHYHANGRWLELTGMD